MKNILALYKRWRKQNSGEGIDTFARWFFEFRYSLPGFDQDQSALQRQIAEVAFPFYSNELNADGAASLLAVLGAVSEAERFLVDPGLVMRKTVGWRFRNLSGPTLGGAGVASLDTAFQAAEQRFKKHLAALERRAMGLE